ncbi:MAG: ABC transporter ATP-binding protein [Candidatus Kapaibacteriales bacterium]
MSKNKENIQEKKYSDREIYKALFKIAKPFKKYFFASAILNAIFALLSAASVAIINPVLQVIFPNEETESSISTVESEGLDSFKETFFGSINELIADIDPLNTLINVCILIIIIYGLKNIVKFFNAINSVKLEEGIVKSVRDKLFEKYTSLSLSYFQKNKQGDVVSTVTNDVTQLNSATVRAFNMVFRDFVQVAIFLALLLALSPKLTLVSFAASGGALVLIRIAKKYLKRYGGRMQQAMANFTSTLSESVAGIKLIKSFDAADVSGEKFRDETSYYVTSALKHRKVTSLVPSIYEMIAIGALCFVLYVGGESVLVEKTMEASDLLTFLFLLFSIMTPLTLLTNHIAEMQRGLVASKRILKVLDLEPTVKSGDKKVKEFSNRIDFTDVSFSYENDRKVLQNINLTIAKNEKIALVGPSGSGKSTFLDLLLRFYDPDSGMINYQDEDLKELNLSEYLGLFGVVSQENILFNDTVRNNILFGKTNISDDEIWKALEISNAKSFVESMPDGLDTMLGERGTTVSGGERQRLAIARAVVRKPEILVFDEATSALDTESEYTVQSAINDSLKGRTAIIVAHRLSTITHCDRIVVFDKGRIAEIGTHEELLELGGIYHTLHSMQSLEKTN